MNPLIFREYDIRGIVDKDLTDSIVFDIGRAYGSMMKKLGKMKVSIGGDCRLSTERFRKVLSDGIISTGCDVFDLGICTTPILYYSVFTMDIHGGIMITGSHNPSNYNGFKICIGKDTIHGEAIQELKNIISSAQYEKGNGRIIEYDIISDYQNYMINNFKYENKIKIAIDAGNGTGGEIILPILRSLGVEVVAINCNMDGNFPVHHPDPTVEKNLQQLIISVKENKLDFGVGYDGDTDRIGVVDNKGNIIWGDYLMLLFAKDILNRNPGATFISEVKASKHLYDGIKKYGGNGIMWKAGHSLIKAKMKETGALLAGEMSGHLFFADKFFGFDDAIYTTLRLIELVDKTQISLAAFLNEMPRTFSTPELRIACEDSKKFKIVEEVTKKLILDNEVIDIDGVRVLFNDGWGLIRASNTQNVLVMRFEADSLERLREIKEYIEKIVLQVSESI